MIFKVIYLLLFWSLDVLIYLFFVKKINKLGRWLIVSAIIWMIIFIAHLPVFHLNHLMPFKYFTTLSAVVLLLLILQYVGKFIIETQKRSSAPDNAKAFTIRFLSIAFNQAIFIVFMVVHFRCILAWHS